MADFLLGAARELIVPIRIAPQDRDRIPVRVQNLHRRMIRGRVARHGLEGAPVAVVEHRKVVVGEIPAREDNRALHGLAADAVDDPSVVLHRRRAAKRDHVWAVLVDVDLEVVEVASMHTDVSRLVPPGDETNRMLGHITSLEDQPVLPVK